MSDYTPSLDDIRDDYAQLTARHRGSFFGNRDAFDRAIDQIQADAKREALEPFRAMSATHDSGRGECVCDLCRAVQAAARHER